MRDGTYIWIAFGLPRPVAEFKFHEQRRWRFDWCWPDLKIAVEQEGGIWTRGRHVRGAGYIKDMEKQNYAGLLGWRIFKFTPSQIRSGEAQNFMRRVFDGITPVPKENGVA